jgi:integrase
MWRVMIARPMHSRYPSAYRGRRDFGGLLPCGKGLLPLSAAILDRVGVDDSIVQGILRHSTVSVTQNHYIKTARADTIAAMRKLSAALLCSN